MLMIHWFMEFILFCAVIWALRSLVRMNKKIIKD